MMDDIQEQTELADEISRAISEPAGFGMDVDEVSTKHYAGCKMYISRNFLISNSSSKVNQVFKITIIGFFCCVQVSVQIVQWEKLD